MKISVIVPAYCPGDGIERVMRSLRDQTMPPQDFEVIIVDDGSPDDTWERLQHIRDAHSNVRISRIENSGWPSRPRNVGTDLARGEYVLYMDHDDELFPAGLQAAYDYAVRHDADVLSPKQLKTTDPSWGLGNFTANIPNALPRRGVDALLPMMPHKLYRRAFLREHRIRFPEGRRVLWEDIYFNVECFRHAKVISILSDTPVYLWHATGQNNSSTYEVWDSEFWVNLHRLMSHISETLGGNEFETARRKQLLHQYRIRVLSRLVGYFNSGQHLEGKAQVLRRAQQIAEEFIPAEWDRSLPMDLRLKSWLLREGRDDLLQQLQQIDRSVKASTHVVGLVWIEGTLHLRARTTWALPSGEPVRFRRQDSAILRALPSDFDDLPASVLDVSEDLTKIAAAVTIRDRFSNQTWNVPTVVAARTDLREADDGLLTLIVDTESVLELSKAAQGKALPPSVWDVHARTIHLVGVRHESVRMGDTARPALIGGYQVVAFGNAKGGLSLDCTGQVASVVATSRPRRPQARLVSQEGADGLTEVRLSLPLDGVRVFRARTHAGQAQLGAPLESPIRRGYVKLRRFFGLRTPEGEAKLTVKGESVTLEVTVSAPAGVWQLFVTFGGMRQVTPFIIRIGVSGAVEMHYPTTEDVAAVPRVSVIMPVYNAGKYLEPAVQSALDQTLPPGELEIIAVDDGSTDGSRELLEHLAAQHGQLRVFTQANSGGASLPRNRAIDEARGRYVYALDSDDLLRPTALEKLADAADALGAEVAMGRLVGLGARRAPASMFRRTDTDADTVDNNLFYFLGPQKLILREHLNRNDIRFPLGVRVGEDQPYSAKAMLTARRIVVLADGEYYALRWREDQASGHLSASRESMEEIFAKSDRLAGIVEMYLSPGRKRDQWMKRVYGSALASLLRGPYLALEPEARQEWVKRVSARFSGSWTASLRSSLPCAVAIKLDLAINGRTDELVDFLEAAGGDERALAVEWSDGNPVVQVPPSVSAVVPIELRRVSALGVEHKLTAIDEGEDTVTLRGWIGAKSIPLAPSAVTLEARLRGSDHAIALPAEVAGAIREAEVHGALFSVDLPVNELTGPGVWDLSMIASWGETSTEPTRLGAKRALSIDTDARPVGDGGRLLYFTATYGNISIDVGETVNRLTTAEVVGLTQDVDGRPQVLLSLSKHGSQVRVYGSVEPRGVRDARHRLPWESLSDDLIAVRLPTPAITMDRIEVRLRVVAKGVVARLSFQELPPLDVDHSVQVLDERFLIRRRVTGE